MAEQLFQGIGVRRKIIHDCRRVARWELSGLLTP